MLIAPLPTNETHRLNAVYRYQILDTPAQRAFDELTALAAYICGTPAALISIVAQQRQWFKSKVGFVACESSRDVAFCAHTILGSDLMIVEDACNDRRFEDNPLVSGEPKIRFYAGAPLITPDNYAVGTIGVIDYVPRQLTSEQKKALQALAHQVVDQLELRRYLIDLASANTERQLAQASHRAALEREKELSDLKSRFITTASHEFRTPLTTILSSSELLERYQHKWTDEKKLSHLGRIQLAVKQMTSLLNDVLLVGKASAGKLEFHPMPLDLAKFCCDLVEEMELTSMHHKIAFVTQAVGTSSQYLTACMDEKLLRHIFINLLSNAIKYSPQSSTIDFSLICQQEYAVFQVSDRGIGIPIADQDKLFDSFHRASNVGTISGTGLGLAIVKKSVDLHGGKIEVESAVGVGTTVTVSLPLNN